PRAAHAGRRRPQPAGPRALPGVRLRGLRAGAALPEAGRPVHRRGAHGAVPGAGVRVIRLVAFDFWQTLLADTPASGAAANALRLSGVGDILRKAGHRYEPAALAAADVRALARLDAIWSEHRDVAPAEQVRIYLEALDPRLPAALAAEDRAAVADAYANPVLTHTPVVAPGAVEAIRTLAAAG